MMEIVMVSLCAILAIVGISAYVTTKQQRQHEQERREWLAERKDLLDRIQAPTFNDYASKVIREKKAEQPKEEEKPIQFAT